MQHQRSHRTLGRDRDERRALLRGLSVSLMQHGKIVTTHAKAKELRPFIEKLITKAKTNTVASRRGIAAQLGAGTEATVSKMITEVAPKYATRSGGYTRIVKLGRTTAGRDEAVIELV
jgi:large subunit ribosomal protein L17